MNEYAFKSPEEWAQCLPSYHHNLLPPSHISTFDEKQEDDLLENSPELKMISTTNSKNTKKIKNLMINHFDKNDNFFVYKIEVYKETCSWIVSRRYREFHRLHEELVQRYNIEWELLPPKKIVGNLKLSNIEKRKILLEKYLKKILEKLPEIPRVLVEFLEMDQFDVHSVCSQLSRDLFQIGDELLHKNSIFKITPLQIHCINRRLLLPLPTFENDDPAEDIGHLYSFIQQVKSVLVYPGNEDHLYIGDYELNFDLSIFKSLTYLEIRKVDTELITGIEAVQKTLLEVRAIRCLQLLKDFLISGEMWSQGLLLTVHSDREDYTNVLSKFTKWEKIKKASFAHNNLHSIDFSIMLLANITVLDLSHNLLTEVQYLEELTFLTDLNLSYNEIRHLADFPFRIPSLSSLNLAGNGIQSIEGLERMFSLQELDISNNNLNDVSDILKLGNLPILENLKVMGNPLARCTNYRTRILVQFGVRGSEVILDGRSNTRRETLHIAELVASRENYDIISEDVILTKPNVTPNVTLTPDGSVLPPTSSANDRLVASTKQALRSPRIKKKLAAISNPGVKGATGSSLNALGSDEEKFRGKVEKLRDEAGDNWLTFYSDMIEQDENVIEGRDKEEGIAEVAGANAITEVGRKSSTIRADGPAALGSLSATPTQCVPLNKRSNENNKPFIRSLSYSEIDLELTDEIRSAVKNIIKSQIDLAEETFLVVDDQGGDMCEHMVAVDCDSHQLLEIDLNTGKSQNEYDLKSIRGLKIEHENQKYLFQFEAIDKAQCNKSTGIYKLVKFVTPTVKEAAGLYSVLKAFNEDFKCARSYSQTSSSLSVANELGENPFDIPKECLLAFFKDFMRKNTKISPSPTAIRQEVSSHYQNIDIGLSFYKHDSTEGATQQDIIYILWVGCLPYLFPDEEIPVCVVLTTVNLFLFRIFVCESDIERKPIQDLHGIQEAMHCFYSFPLKNLREVVIGLFDQGIRIEVSEEGARGTFVFLTRDANKTAKFLDALASIFGFKNEKEIAAFSKNSPQQSHEGVVVPSIVYPDESKINALKLQLQEQSLLPLSSRENLISYSIVYERRETDNGSDFYNELSVPYLRSLILTNNRLLLCDEDYVHWPLPSFVRSAPLTPQWIVDDIDKIDNIIGIDIWEDLRGKLTMAGCYGVTITFEKTSVESVSSSNVWSLLFQSLAEREQFVRSLACLWKNNFDQDLKITYSKVPFYDTKKAHLEKVGNLISHKKNSSNSNISVAPSQCLNSPEMFVVLDRSRLNDVFRKKITDCDEEVISGVQFVTCIGCKPFNYPELEIPVALLLGERNIYLICSTQHQKYMAAYGVLEDHGAVSSLYINKIQLSCLRQVVIGLFDQCFRLETDAREHTFLFVTRNFDRTNDFIQRLSQVLLALPDLNPLRPDEQVDVVLPEQLQQRSVSQIFQMFKKDDENAETLFNSEFIHPRTNIKFVYPSDETLSKLKYRISDYVQTVSLLPEVSDFGILLYALLYECHLSEELAYTFVISEQLVCLISEDHVNYPLPLFVKELPMSSQYNIISIHLMLSLLYIEFDDFHSGTFTLVFNRKAVQPNMYEERFETTIDENDACLVTDINRSEDHVITWNLKAFSHIEREKIFSVLSKTWSMIYVGRSLPIHRKKKDVL